MSDLCLILGGAGFIGSHTADALLKNGYRVRILDSLQERVHPHGKPDYLPVNAEFIKGDVSNPRDLENALKDVSYVFHFAAYQDYLPDFSTFIRVNAESTALLYEIIVEKKLEIKKVIIASSQAVLGEGQYHCKEHGNFFPDLRVENDLENAQWEHLCPTCKKELQWTPTPESAVKPRNQYAISKYSQELLGLALGKRYEIPSVCMRYSIVQGPRQSFYNAYSGACRVFCLSLYFDQAPLIFEDGLQIRDYVNIDDVVAANMLVLEKEEANYQMFNVGGGETFTVIDFAKIVAQVYNTEAKFNIPGVYRFGDTRHIFSDVSKLKSLGWKAKKSPHDSVTAYVNWLREQNNVKDILNYVEKNMKKLNVLRDTKKKAA